MVDSAIHGDRWELRVQDDGGGFAPERLDEVRERIDDYLHRVQTNDGSRALSIGGMGLVSTVARLKHMFKEPLHYAIGNEVGVGAEIVFSGTLK